MSAIATIVAAVTVGVVELLIYLVATVVGAIATMVVTRASEASNRRRDRYSQALRTLVAWIEYPYRVRRRTDDDPATLTALADHGHELQERLAYHQARIATDHPNLARAYAGTRAMIDAVVGPAISEAWESNPVTKPTDMNLNGWGPGEECKREITNLQNEIQYCFGFRGFRRFAMRTVAYERQAVLDSAPLSARLEGSIMEYEIVFNPRFRRAFKRVLGTVLIVFVPTLVWLLAHKSSSPEDLATLSQWMLAPLPTFILASMALYWWILRRVTSWPNSTGQIERIVFPVGWVAYLMGFAMQVGYGLIGGVGWVAMSVFWAAVSVLILVAAGFVGVRVLDVDRQHREN